MDRGDNRLVRRISDEQRRWRLAHRHHLAHRSVDLVDVAGSMVGLHSSDPATVFLSASARVAGATVESIERALYEDRSLVRVHGIRRTMFVIPRELWPVYDAAAVRDYLPAQIRRMAKLVEAGVEVEDGIAWTRSLIDETVALIGELGTSPATDLTDRLPRLGTRIQNGPGTFAATSRILSLAALEREIMRGKPRGSWVASQYEWSTTAQWLGSPPEWIEDPRTARAELLGRWLETFGPGTVVDLQWWTGWGKTKTAQAMEDLGAVEVELDTGTGYVTADDSDVDDPGPWVAFLPGLDPTPMGWKEREWFGGPFPGTHYDRNGNIGPTIWVDGTIVGAWATARAGSVVVQLDDTSLRDRVEPKRAELEEWLAGTVITPRFRTPIERDLMG